MKVYLAYVETYDNYPTELKGVFFTNKKAEDFLEKYFYNKRNYVEEVEVK